MAVKSVWVVEGCILCGACEAECPDVFVVNDDSAVIKAAVREDGVEDTNRESKSPLKVEFQTSLEEGIKAGAAACPVEVIQYE